MQGVGEQIPRRNVKRFRRGLVCEAHRPLYHSTLGLRVIKKKKKKTKLRMKSEESSSVAANLSKSDTTFREREFFIDNLLVRIHLIIEMVWWTGLAPWEIEVPFPGSHISTFRVGEFVEEQNHLHIGR